MGKKNLHQRHPESFLCLCFPQVQMADNFIFFWRLFCILIFLNLKKINVQKQPRSNLGTKRYNIFKVVKSFEVNTFLDRQRTLGIHFHFFICLSQVSFLRMYHFRDTVLGPRNTNMLPSPPIFSLWGRRGTLPITEGVSLVISSLCHCPEN